MTNEKVWTGNRPRLSVLCAKPWKVSTFFTTWKKPLTSPPIVFSRFSPTLIAADVVYLNLHGLLDEPYLYGGDFQTTFSTKQIEEAPRGCFKNSLVFLEGCFGAKVAESFLEAGAVSVVGNLYQTKGRPFTLGSSSIIGKAWLQAIWKQVSVETALHRAIKKVRPPHDQGWIIFGDKEAKYV